LGITKLHKKLRPILRKIAPFVAIAAALIPGVGLIISAALTLAITVDKAKQARDMAAKTKKKNKEELAQAEAEIKVQEAEVIRQLDEVYNSNVQAFTALGMPQSKWNGLGLDAKVAFMEMVMNAGNSPEGKAALDKWLVENPGAAPEDAIYGVVVPSPGVTSSLTAGTGPAAPTQTAVYNPAVYAPGQQAAPLQMNYSQPSGGVQPNYGAPMSQMAPVPSPQPMITEMQAPVQAGPAPEPAKKMNILIPLGIAAAALFALTGGGGQA
jgi:hypothetical protein